MGGSVKCVDVGDGVGFCYPNAGENGSFLITIGESIPTSYDPNIIQKVLGGRARGATPILNNALPDGVPPATRVYDISESMPPIIRSSLWKQAPYHGPNCYQTAFCASGLEYTCGRYVDSTEAEFLLSLFYYLVPNEACGKEFGTIAIFHEHLLQLFGDRDILLPKRSEEELKASWLKKVRERAPLRRHIPSLPGRAPYSRGFDAQNATAKATEFKLPYIDAGSHMAFSLTGGLVFHKPSPDGFDGYTITTIDEVGKELDTAAIRKMRDPIERWTYINTKRNYTYVCVAPRKEIPNIVGERLPEEERKRFITLLDFYSDLVLDASNRSKVDSELFEKNRLSLITVENMWAILGEIQDKIGASPKLFLSRDLELAKSYFRAYSLSWQYSYMSSELYVIKEWDVERKMEQLYTNHYFKPDERFVREIEVHLKVRGVPREKWGMITKSVIERIAKEFDAIKRNKDTFRSFYMSNGARKIDFSRILDEEIHRLQTAN